MDVETTLCAYWVVAILVIVVQDPIRGEQVVKKEEGRILCVDEKDCACIWLCK